MCSIVHLLFVYVSFKCFQLAKKVERWLEGFEAYEQCVVAIHAMKTTCTTSIYSYTLVHAICSYTPLLSTLLHSYICKTLATQSLKIIAVIGKELS